MPSSDVTPYFVFLVLVYALGSLQFGYHIGELNTPQAAITCADGSADEHPIVANLASCIPMSDVQYGVVVALFSVGGLLGSLVAGRLSDRLGRRTVSLSNSAFFMVGPLIMASSNSVALLCIGRVLCGIGSGVSMVTVPIFLSEISPIQIRGAVGVMTQLSCVVGILLSQLAGVFLTGSQWRVILVCGTLLGLLQFSMLWGSVESPRWLASQPGKFVRAKELLIYIRGREDIQSEMKTWLTENEDTNPGVIEEERHTLLRSHNSDSPSFRSKLSLTAFLSSGKYRAAIVAVFLTQAAQQFTGTNAVIFYSTSILASLLPSHLSAWISVGISVVNLVVTFIAANLIDRTGRRSLLLTSLAGMCLSSLLLAIGINENIRGLSATAATMIIASFAIGLGPIPFLLISEYFDTDAVGLAQSFGLSVNWIATFCIGLFFPIMRQSIGGSSFYVFASIALLSFVGVWKLIPESRGKTVSEIWSR